MFHLDSRAFFLGRSKHTQIRPIHNGRKKKNLQMTIRLWSQGRVLGIFSYYDLEEHGWHEGNLQVRKSRYLQNIIPICVAFKNLTHFVGTWLGHNIEVPHGFLYPIHHTSYIMGWLPADVGIHTRYIQICRHMWNSSWGTNCTSGIGKPRAIAGRAGIMSQL